MTTANAPCGSAYGILVCQRSHVAVPAVHAARLFNGEITRWGDGCNETRTVDCGWCRGELRTTRELIRAARDGGQADG